jgi:hypothetical protein
LFCFLLTLLLGNVGSCRYLVNHISSDGAGFISSISASRQLAGNVPSGHSTSNRSTRDSALHRLCASHALV